MPHIYHTPGDRYIVAGEDDAGRRFRLKCETPHVALAVHITRGSVFQVKIGSARRVRIKRVG